MPFWRVFLGQFHNPLIYILGLAAAVSFAIGEWTDGSFIAVVLVINAAIGSVQEWRAERSSHALERLVRTRATVVRDGESIEVDSEQLVPGDIVGLESGNRVPADARLLSAHGLEIDESSLTGESLPVVKDADWTGPPETPIADRRCIAHAGTMVARGRGRALVVATGTRTVIGQLAVDVTGTASGAPPLLVRMQRFTRAIGIVVLLASAGVAAIGVIGQGQPIGEMFLFAVALAVAAIPEGLPVALTVALSVATHRMARRKVIVRKLAAVEGLGSCTLIATDKTGTLTCNELTVRMVEAADGNRWHVEGQGYTPEGEVVPLGDAAPPSREAVEALGRVAALCNEAQLHRHDGEWSWRGDPTDVALLSFAKKLGLSLEALSEALPQIDQIPFEPEHRFAATIHREGEAARVMVKGAPERVLDMCALEPEEHRQAASRAAALAREGYRVLAFAEGRVGLPAPEEAPVTPAGLRFLGFAGMIDPPRPGVHEAIRECRRAGIRVIMITGDHPVTAYAIAKELGLAESEDEVVSAAALESGGPDHELSRLLDRVTVFARVSPQQKLQIVEAARRAGHFVAVTGDGVNDAPALRTANIGVAMGRSGTDVAREAADLVISDDNFSTIVSGIEEGRVAFSNVRKVIYLLVSTGAAEIVVVALCLASGLPLPLLPAQLLWLNLVTQGIQDVALAFEPPEGNLLDRAPRPTNERIFDRLMVERTIVGALVMGTVGFLWFRYALESDMTEGDARNTLLLLMVLFLNVHIGNCRSETQSIFRLPPYKSPVLLVGALAAFGVHFLAMHTAFGERFLQLTPVSPTDWLTIVALALTVTVAMELHKFSWWRRTQ